MQGSSGEPRAAGAEDRVRRYLELLEAGDAEPVVEFVRKLAASGVPTETIILEVIASAQARIGWLWQSNVWSVAQEHTATYLGERALEAAMEDALAAKPPQPRGSVAMACVDGEWHALSARMVADVLRLRGWRVDYLGASTPEPHLVAYLQQHDPYALALSCTLSSRLPTAYRMSEAARRFGVPVLAGGPGFGEGGVWATALGADAWAGGARSAADVLERGLVLRRRPGGRGPGISSVPAHSEYLGLLRRRRELLGIAVDRAMESRPGDEEGPSEEERDRTVEDAGHLVDFLAVSLYVTDPALFVRFLGWMEKMLDSRPQRFRMLTGTLEAFEAALHDHPAALAVLREGRAAVSA